MSKIYSGVLPMQRPRSRRMDQFGSRDHGKRKAILTGRVDLEKSSATARCHANGGRATTVVTSSYGLAKHLHHVSLRDLLDRL